MNLECLNTIDCNQGAIRAVRFNGRLTIDLTEFCYFYIDSYGWCGLVYLCDTQDHTAKQNQTTGTVYFIIKLEHLSWWLLLPYLWLRQKTKTMESVPETTA